MDLANRRSGRGCLAGGKNPFIRNRSFEPDTDAPLHRPDDLPERFEAFPAEYDELAALRWRSFEATAVLRKVEEHGTIFGKLGNQPRPQTRAQAGLVSLSHRQCEHLSTFLAFLFYYRR